MYMTFRVDGDNGLLPKRDNDPTSGPDPGLSHHGLAPGQVQVPRWNSNQPVTCPHARPQAIHE